MLYYKFVLNDSRCHFELLSEVGPEKGGGSPNLIPQPKMLQNPNPSND